MHDFDVTLKTHVEWPGDEAIYAAIVIDTQKVQYTFDSIYI